MNDFTMFHILYWYKELGLKKKEIAAIDFAFDVYDFKGNGQVDASFIVKAVWADKAIIAGSDIPGQGFWSLVKTVVEISRACISLKT